MRDNVHTIKRLSVALETDRKSAFEERSKIVSALQNTLSVELERVMDEMCRPDEVIRIDQLKLDLGTIKKNQFERTFIDAFRKKLKESIVRIHHEHEMKANKQSQTVTRSMEDQFAAKKSVEDREFDALIFFLNHGAIPWWSPFESMVELEHFVGKLTKQHAIYLSRFKQELIQNTWFRERFIFTFQSSIVLELIRKFFPDSFEKQVAVIELMAKCFDAQLRTNNRFEKLKIVQITDNCIFENTNKTNVLRDFIRLHKLVFHEKERTEWLRNDKKKAEIQKWVTSLDVGDSKVTTEEWYNLIISEMNVSSLNENTTSINVEESLQTDNRKPTEINERSPESEQTVNLKQNESVRLKYAGVVIAWPMFKVLFEARGLLQEDKFIDVSTQHKAVQLLNYLVSGQDYMEEYEMPLNKLLCGVHPSFPFRNEVSLSQEDKAEVEELLAHIIATWKELKNTSIAGLRSSFIQRPAMLEEKENTWFLKVEQSGIDILMGKIPWGYSLIKLPWMEKMIQVEW